MFPRATLVATVLLLAVGVAIQASVAEADDTVPPGYKLVWSDEFTSLSLRTGGPTYRGLELGSGTWSAPGVWYSSDPRGVAGNGDDWFVDPSYSQWPAGYPAEGQFAITKEGLRIRAELAPPAIAELIPSTKSGAPRWISGQISSFHSVRISPPFYFEARAKMPAGVGRPFPAIWLLTGAKHPWPNDYGKGYEIDVQEGFGDSDQLHSTIHWNPTPDTPEYPFRAAVNKPSGVELSVGFNTWGCLVTKQQQIFFFNGKEEGRVETPSTANADQPFGILLDVSAGLPWRNGGPPSGGPHDMIVRYVKLYAPDKRGLTLR